MGTKYLIWKDKNCNGVNPEWLFLSGKEFFDFIKSEQSKGRYFFRQSAFEPDDDNIVIECTEKQYKSMKKEKRRSEYLLEQQKSFETVSVYSFEDEDNVSLYDKKSSGEPSIEELIENFLMVDSLKIALSRLYDDEIKIIELYFFTDDATERTTAKKMGISKTAFNKRKENILIKLKKLIDQN